MENDIMFILGAAIVLLIWKWMSNHRHKRQRAEINLFARNLAAVYYHAYQNTKRAGDGRSKELIAQGVGGDMQRIAFLTTEDRMAFQFAFIDAYKGCEREYPTKEIQN